MSGPLLANLPSASAQTFASWNPHVTCTAQLVPFSDVYGNGGLSGNKYQTGSNKGGVPNKRALSPPCTVTNTGGQVLSSFVQINNVYLPSLLSEDCSTTFNSVNGGGSYPDYNGDGKADSFCDSTGNIHPITGSGSIHIEFDHDWKAAHYCGPGFPPCDPNAIVPYFSSGSVSLDVQGFVYWDISHWELHPFTGWRLSGSSPSPLSASFSYTPQNPSPGSAITFTGTATGGTVPYSFNWNFGDGGTATGNPATHIFTAEGNYNVTLTVTDSASQTAKSSQIVMVKNQVSYTFGPTDDAYVQQDLATSNFGAASVVIVDNSPVRQFLLKFNPQFTGTVTSATLRLFQVDASDKGGDFHTVPSNWTETTVNWNNAPAANPSTFFALGRVSSNTWYNVDVTSVVIGSGVVSLRITTTSTDGSQFSSKEGANPPQLIVSVASSSNTPPTLVVPGSLTVNEGSLLSFKVNATDSAGQTITLSSSGLPASSTFTSTPASGSVSGTFSWTPSESQGPGDYAVSFTATDNLGAATTRSVMIHVNEVNTAPSLTVPGPQTVVEGSTLAFTVTATDSDVPTNSLTFSASGLPSGSNFNTATRTFTWTPTTGQSSGSPYTVSFTVTDSGSPPLANTRTVTITVLSSSSNNPPSLYVPGPQAATVGSTLTFIVSTSDSDTPPQTVALSASGLPSGASFPTVTGNPVSGTFSFTPGPAQAGMTFTVAFTATDNGTSPLSTSKTVTITVSGGISYALVSASDGKVYRYYSNGTISLVGQQGSTILRQVAWRPDGSYALIVGESAVLLKYDGDQLTLIPTGAASTFAFFTVAWKPDGSYALIGGSGGVLKYDGTSTTIVSSPVSATIRAISWNPSGSQALLVGSSGVILLYTAITGQLQSLASGTTQNLYAAAWNPNGLYALAGGTNGLLAKYDGTQVIIIPTTGIYNSALTVRYIAWNSAGTLALLAGDSGLLLSYNGSALTSLASGTANGLYSIAWLGNTATIVGNTGTVLMFSNGAAESQPVSTTSSLRGIAWKA